MFAIGVEHAKVYTSIASMIVESAALYSVTGMVYLICYARGSNVQNLIISALDQIIVSWTYCDSVTTII